MAEIDYQNVDYRQTAVEDWSTAQRRAAVLDEVFAMGTPKALNKTELADRFGVHRNTIYNDLNALGAYLAEELEAEDIRLRVRSCFERAQSELFEAEKPGKAWKVTREWAEWLGDIGAIRTEPERIEAEVTARETAAETEDYKVILDESERAGDRHRILDDEELS